VRVAGAPLASVPVADSVSTGTTNEPPIAFVTGKPAPLVSTIGAAVPVPIGVAAGRIGDAGGVVPLAGAARPAAPPAARAANGTQSDAGR
jgi:hypothetical protein